MKMMTEPRAFDLLTMGEIMLRLSPPNNERITRGDVLEKRAGGSELNVASGVSLLGLRSGIITKLPDNPVGMFIRNWVRYCDVSDDYIVFDRDPDARLGIYYYENGAHPRKPRVVYDRKNSSMTRFSPDEIPDTVYASTRMFHTSGITLALSESNRRAAIEMIRRFKQAGAQISLDVNYRANLWSESDAYATTRTSTTSVPPSTTPNPTGFSPSRPTAASKWWIASAAATHTSPACCSACCGTAICSRRWNSATPPAASKTPSPATSPARTLPKCSA